MTTYTDRQAVIDNILDRASGTAARVYAKLANMMYAARKNGRAFICPRIQTIADQIHRSYRSVQRAFKWLEAHGLLDILPRWGKKLDGTMARLSSKLRVMLTATAATLRQVLAAAAAKPLNLDISVTGKTQAKILKKNPSLFRAWPSQRQPKSDPNASITTSDDEAYIWSQLSFHPDGTDK